MQVRLLASGPVRSAALAVHLLLEKLHGGGGPASVPGRRAGEALPGAARPRCRW